MLVAIYHMIRDDTNFHPIDQEEVTQKTKNTQGLNLKNVLIFLKEHGADRNMIRMVEEQCSENTEIKDAKEKQSNLAITDASQPIQESVNGMSLSTSNRVAP